jgi:uncharacterized protein|tara:strand:- start:454 stop:960 length:507 start_codon:yes stop_codon:yes gene_type:complete
MNPLVNYKIPFMGLKPGNHTFKMDVDPQFFACFPESEIQNAKGVLDVILEFSETTMTLRLALDITWKVPCGRCLEELTFPLQVEDKIAVSIGEKTEYNDTLWILSKNEFELDLSQTIYELAHLARPPHQVHESESDCDPKMLGYTMNDSIEESKRLTDPRWDALKNLK